MDIDVRDNPAESRYEVLADGELAGFAQYKLDGDRITMYHTEVDPEHEGAGLGGRLARQALDDVRARGLRVAVPVHRRVHQRASGRLSRPRRRRHEAAGEPWLTRRALRPSRAAGAIAPTGSPSTTTPVAASTSASACAACPRCLT